MIKEANIKTEFKKDPNEEMFLEKLNDILQPHQEKEYRPIEEIFPTLFIVGVPRSGSTLLSQLVSAHLDVGYINNLIAAFWKAPVYGIRLSKKLLPEHGSSSFQSTFGRTKGIREPHEFGYFWSTFFDENHLAQKTQDETANIDWRRMKHILTHMTYAFRAPVVFKYLPMGWYMSRVRKVLAKSCFIRIRRDPVQNAISLYNSRKKFLEAPRRWFSLKPLEYDSLKDKPLHHQVAGQVFHIDRSLDLELEKIAPAFRLDIGYDDLCANPKKVLADITDMLNKAGGDVTFTREPQKKFDLTKKDPAAEAYAQLTEAVNKLYT
ncbi:MAG: sulfotransferase [bacterium]|nr:sulfotransferase [bacterium]